jgi:uncharacterized integral membrane protein
MKAFYLAGSIIFTVIILIIAFGNIQAQCAMLTFFFFPVKANPTIVILGFSVIGIITGLFYHAFIVRVLESGVDEDEDFE